MSDFATKLLPMVKKTLRQADNEFDDEIGSYIDTVATDLQDAGIHYSFFSSTKPGWVLDGQILQACRWYALSVFGLYNPDMEKYALAYASLKATLATQKRYTIKGQYPTGYEHGYADGYGDAVSKLIPLNISDNGEYFPDGDSIGFSSVSAKVSGKMRQVLEGTLKELTADEIYGVTTLSSLYNILPSLEKISFPDTITSFPNNVFLRQKNLNSVTFADVSEISLGMSVFSDCTSLEEVIIPGDSIRAKSITAFGGCTKLSKIDISKFRSLGGQTFMNCSSLKSAIIDVDTTLGAQVFQGCTSLETVVIENMTDSREKVFLNCTALKTVTVKLASPPVQSYSDIFTGCTALEKIIVPIGSAAAYKKATNWSKYADIIVEEDIL